jgi:hypothetical protein
MFSTKSLRDKSERRTELQMMSESAISKRMLTQTGQKIILNFQVAIRVAHSNGAWTSSKYDSSAIAWRT